MSSISKTDFLTALYRGMLHREPDALGLAAHEAALDAADPRALVGAVQNFLGSEEFRNRHQSGDLLGQLRPVHVRHDAAPFAHIVSLGTHCYTSWLLKQDGLKRYSGPFDWIFSTLAMVQHCIEDDFREFLNTAHYEALPEADRPRPNEGMGEHRYYLDELGVRMVFNHYDPSLAETHRYFARSVDRFRRVLASPDRKLFLAITTDDRIMPTDFPALAALIDRVTTNAQLLVVRVLAASHDDRNFGLSSLDRRGEHQLLVYQPTSPLRGLGFTEPFDDLMLRRLLRTLPVALANDV